MKKLSYIQIVLFLTAISIAFFPNALNAKTSFASNGDIKWTPISESVSFSKSNNKKFILVVLYTDWDGWYKKMNENTFQDDGVVSLINSGFTPVKFNAETQDPVTFNGKTYNFTKTGARGANQLALDLGSIGGKLGYPTVVVLDEDGKKLQAFPGFKDVETMITLLKYYNTGSYKTMDFQQFQTGQ